jgi:hypothetical protein
MLNQEILPLSDGSVWVLKSPYDDELGPDTVQEFFAACFAWLVSSNARRVTSATITKVVADINFKKLIDIHLRLKESGKPTLFPDYLITLTKCTRKMPFLIIYTFITGETPDCFRRCRVGSLPVPKVAKVMLEQGLSLDLIPEEQYEQLPWFPVANQSFEEIRTQKFVQYQPWNPARQPIECESSEFSSEKHIRFRLLLHISKRLTVQMLPGK